MRRGLLASAAVFAVVFVSGAAHLADVSWLGAIPKPAEAPAARSSDRLSSDSGSSVAIIPRELKIHPDQIYRQFLSTRAAVSDLRTLEIVRRFQDLLSLFSLRQSADDNFTMRVLDSRTGGLLELHSLDSLRTLAAEGAADWQEIDRIRRRVTTDLVDRHEQLGTPRHAVTVKWGRRDQVLEARSRDTPFIEHEINMARMLDLSLLATEIGTVETFNDDRVVSRVGARSRYQMMPSVLRDLGVEHYVLRTPTGRRVDVREEWHPLISLEASFTVARAYSNATGHEIPGLSAYHTGPYNVFRIFREYLTADTTLFTGNSNVVRAYQWGLTDGFANVSAHTSFGVQSRGYLPSLYGAMKATEAMPIDTSLTLLVERVVLKTGASVLLSQLLDSLDSVAPRLDWRTPSTDSTTYQRFRRINPHINLPPQANAASVPVEANVKLVPEVRSTPVRFFLPRGASRLLADAGFAVIDETRTVAFDHRSHDVREDQRTDTDDAYAALVSDVRNFGFTFANRERLDAIYESMKDDYGANPTNYRRMAMEVARLHRWVWRSRNFDALATEVETARARVTIPAMAPAPLPALIQPKPLGPLQSQVTRRP